MQRAMNNMPPRRLMDANGCRVTVTERQLLQAHVSVILGLRVATANNSPTCPSGRPNAKAEGT